MICKIKKLMYQHDISIIDKMPAEGHEIYVLRPNDLFLYLNDTQRKYFGTCGVYYHFKTGKYFALFKNLFE